MGTSKDSGLDCGYLLNASAVNIQVIREKDLKKTIVLVHISDIAIFTLDSQTGIKISPLLEVNRDHSVGGGAIADRKGLREPSQFFSGVAEDCNSSNNEKTQKAKAASTNDQSPCFCMQLVNFDPPLIFPAVACAHNYQLLPIRILLSDLQSLAKLRGFIDLVGNKVVKRFHRPIIALGLISFV